LCYVLPNLFTIPGEGEDGAAKREKILLIVLSGTAEDVEALLEGVCKFSSLFGTADAAEEGNVMNFRESVHFDEEVAAGAKGCGNGGSEFLDEELLSG